jgi:hypothetical protein
LHRYLRYAILENLDTVRRIPAGRVLGVPVSVTPWLWLGPVVFFGLGLALNAALPLGQAARQAGWLAAGIEISTLIHALGHILGGRLVGSPMDELLLTALRGVNIYRGEQAALPGRVHLARAAGGPALNLIACAAAAWLAPLAGAGPAGQVLAQVASTSLFMGLGGLLPLPSVDGEVIWRVARRWARSRRQAQAKT